MRDSQIVIRGAGNHLVKMAMFSIFKKTIVPTMRAPMTLAPCIVPPEKSKAALLLATS